MRPVRPAIDFSYPGIAEDVSRLRTLLRESMELLQIVAPPSPRILNLACGRADETGVLLEILCDAGPAAHYLGIDLRAAEIAEATRRWAHLGKSHGLIEFRVADASRAHHWPASEPFDFIFIRHQNYWDAPAVWDQIFRHALARLSATGLLIFTSYFEREHELALAALKMQRAQLLLDLPHRESRPLADAPGKSVDRRLAILAGESGADHLPREKILHL